jgi:hypothetical protein
MFTVLLLCLLAAVSGTYLRDTVVSNTTCVCTTVPCPVSGSNSLTVGKLMFESCDFDFEFLLLLGGGSEGMYYYVVHGSYAVISSASITITSKDLDKGTDTTSCTQSYSRMLDDDGVQDCDAGHILANRLGGPGNQPINIFPQDLSINRGAYAQYEDSIYSCFKSGATSASLAWTFSYESSSQTKPIKVVYKATFDKGCSDKSETFTN